MLGNEPDRLNGPFRGIQGGLEECKKQTDMKKGFVFDSSKWMLEHLYTGGRWVSRVRVKGVVFWGQEGILKCEKEQMSACEKFSCIVFIHML